MSAGALVLMILVLAVVWGGLIISLGSAARQERDRKRASEDRDEEPT